MTDASSITALDTNVLSALFRNEPGAPAISARLHALQRTGPGLTPQQLTNALQHAGITVDWETSRPMWDEAGLAYANYALRRQRSGGGLPRRLLVDFLIGAHASVNGAALYTLDPQHYQIAFPNLSLI